MQTKTKHTPLPWHYTSGNHGCEFVYAADGYMVADVGRIQKRGIDEAKENAAFIAAACNSHYALVEALEALCSLEIKGHSLMSRLQFSEEGRVLSAKITAALAQAQGVK